MRALAVALIAAALVSACQLFPNAGLSRDRAIELALQAGFGLEQPIVVTGAREGRLGDLHANQAGQLGPGFDLNQTVWQITLQGTTTVCPPVGAGGAGACQRFAATTQVYLDHATGDFLFAETTGQPAAAP